MKTIIVLSVLAVLYGRPAFALEVNEGYDNLNTLSGLEISDGSEKMNTFPKEFSFEIHEDLTHLENWRLKLHYKTAGEIKAWKLILADGRHVNAFAVHKSGLIVGAASPVDSIVISQVSPSGRGKGVTVLFLKGNKTIKPKPSDIGVFNFDLKRQKFNVTPSLKDFRSFPVYLVVDKSFSMFDVMKHVKAAGKNFLKSLPDTMHCTQIAFNRGLEILDKGLKPCRESTQYLDRIKASGGTNIYSALNHAYMDASAKKLPGGIRPLVMVVTDGAHNFNKTVSKAQVIASMKKSQAATLVFWAGDVDTKPLEGIAAYQMKRTRDIKSRLDEYFKSVKTFIGRQTMLYVPDAVKRPVAGPKVARRP